MRLEIKFRCRHLRLCIPQIKKRWEKSSVTYVYSHSRNVPSRVLHYRIFFHILSASLWISFSRELNVSLWCRHTGSYRWFRCERMCFFPASPYERERMHNSDRNYCRTRSCTRKFPLQIPLKFNLFSLSPYFSFLLSPLARIDRTSTLFFCTQTFAYFLLTFSILFLYFVVVTRFYSEPDNQSRKQG